MLWRKIILFTALSFLLALLIDAITLYIPHAFPILGIIRMWSVALTVIICTLLIDGDLKILREYFLLSRKSVAWYLISPIVVYVVLGLYIVIATSLGIFDFSRYVEAIYEALKSTMHQIPDEQLRQLATISAYIQIISAYPVALTINTLAAIGEEIGWRGYLYKMLGSKLTLRNIFLIGFIWGLWHASLILLIGYNYYYNRIPGVVLFTLFTISTTYIHLLVVDKAGGSILPASSLHGAVNALWGLTIVGSTISVETSEIIGGLGVVGIITWSISSLLIYYLDKVLSKGLLKRKGVQGA